MKKNEVSHGSLRFVSFFRPNINIEHRQLYIDNLKSKKFQGLANIDIKYIAGQNHFDIYVEDVYEFYCPSPVGLRCDYIRNLLPDKLIDTTYYISHYDSICCPEEVSAKKYLFKVWKTNFLDSIIYNSFSCFDFDHIAKHSPSHIEAILGEKRTTWMINYDPMLNKDFSEKKLRKISYDIYKRFWSVSSYSEIFGNGEFIMNELVVLDDDNQVENAMDFQEFITREYGLKFNSESSFELLDINYFKGYFEGYNPYRKGMYKHF